MSLGIEDHTAQVASCGKHSSLIQPHPKWKRWTLTKDDDDDNDDDDEG